MGGMLRDWKPGKNLSAKARRAATRLGHCLPPFRPSPYDVADGEELPNYFAECKRCGKVVILAFEVTASGRNFHYFGPAVDGRDCRGNP